MTYFKLLFFSLFGVVICSFKANAALPLPMALGEGIPMTETQEFLLTGDCIMLVRFPPLDCIYRFFLSKGCS